MPFTAKALPLVLLVLWCFACSRSTTSPANPIGTVPPDFYVAGLTGGVIDTAVYWTSEGMTRLPKMSAGSVANSIFVEGGNVYVAGREQFFPAVWINGIETKLADSGDAESVFVSGGDVYVAGFLGTTPVYWKNGIEVALPMLPGSWSGEANAIAVSGSDVYVVGGDHTINAGNAGSTALFWKNGILIPLEADSLDSYASGLCLSGGDVYITGSSGSRTAYWKNGVETKLGDSSYSGSGICVNGADVYVVGVEYVALGFQTTLWTNGVPQRLGQGAGASVLANGRNVYVAGTLNNKATLWTNGTPMAIGPYGSIATCVFAP